jgi:hypothetical protein
MGLSQSTQTDLSPEDWSNDQCLTGEPSDAPKIIQIRHNLFDLTDASKGTLIDSDSHELCRILPNTPKDLMHIVNAKTNQPLVTVYLPNMDQLMSLELPSYHLYTYRPNFEGQTPYPAHDNLHGYNNAPLYAFAHFDRTQVGLLLGTATHFCYSQIVATNTDDDTVGGHPSGSPNRCSNQHVLCRVVLEDDEAGLLKVKVMSAKHYHAVIATVSAVSTGRQPNDEPLMELHVAPGLDALAMVVLTILGDHYWTIHKQHHPSRRRTGSSPRANR